MLRLPGAETAAPQGRRPASASSSALGTCRALPRGFLLPGGAFAAPSAPRDGAATVRARPAVAAAAARRRSSSAADSSSSTPPPPSGGGGGGSSGGGVAVAEPSGDRVEDRELYDEAYNSYLSYAMSVIVSRAIPDARDGLKPVHRRILFAMHELSLLHTKPFKKCARVVGEVLGKFHPHGDGAVYDAIVRLAQAFSMRQTLVDGHGNFGSVDNDPAAAMRYTECRLTAFATDALLRDLSEHTVAFAPTFDASQSEPTVLPAVVPNLLINGSSGIAVGIACSLPPHNTGEVVAALRALIANPGASTAELMRHVRGPDFPTGGQLVAGPDLLQVYETGSGSVVLRGTAAVEGRPSAAAAAAAAAKRGARRSPRKAASADGSSDDDGGGGGGGERIIITELPYQVYKAALVARIAELAESRALEGVADVRDESDRQGMRVVVEVKAGHSAEALLNQLYVQTELQRRVHYNCVALAGGSRPRLMGLKEMLSCFLAFRCDVVTRRSSAALAAAEARRHLVEGFLGVLTRPGALDKVVAAVRGAADGAAAAAALVGQLGLTAEQAEAILGLTLRRLTGLEADKLSKERAELDATIGRLRTILTDRAALLRVVEDEAAAVAADYPDPRRTALLDAADVAAAASSPEASLPAKPCLLMASSRGFLKRLPEEALAPQGRNTRGKLGIKMREGDGLAALAGASDHHELLMLTPEGRAYLAKADAVPSQSSGQTSGASVANVLKLKASFPVAALLPLPAGLLPVARAAPRKAASGSGGSGSGDSDGGEADAEAEAEAAAEAEAEADAGEGGPEEEGEDAGAGDGRGAAGPSIVVASRGGKIKRIAVPPVRINKLGLQFAGVASGDELGWAALLRSSEDVVALVTAQGQGLLVPATQLPLQGRAAKGVKAVSLGSSRRRGDSLAALAVVPAPAAALLRGGSGAAAGGDAEEGAEDELEEEVEEAEAAEGGAEDGTDAAAAAARPPAGPCLLVVSAQGMGKRLPLSELQLGRRAGAGVRVMRLATAAAARLSRSERAAAKAAAAAAGGGKRGGAAAAAARGADRVAAAVVVDDDDEVVLGSRRGVVVRVSAAAIPVQGRNTRGVGLMELDVGDELAHAAAAPKPAPLPAPAPVAAAAKPEGGEEGGGAKKGSGRSAKGGGDGGAARGGRSRAVSPRKAS